MASHSFLFADHMTEIPGMQSTNTGSSPEFRYVLVATDFSFAARAAFRAAVEFCLQTRAKLLLLHVFEYSEIVPPESGGMLLELQSCCERCQECLAGLAQEAKEAGIECETMLESGVAPVSILDIIADKNIDLAFIGTRALHGFERLVFGSTAEQVLRRALCPVLTVGPRAAQELPEGLSHGPVVFATDFNFTTMHAIRYAADLAGILGVPLHCLHVLPRAFDAGQQRDIVPAIMAEALKQLAAESGAHMEAPKFATTFGSEVSYAVVDYARQQRASLIVLGVRQASLLASHVPEHITYRIITEASCPVLTMAYGAHAEQSQMTIEPKTTHHTM